MTGLYWRPPSGSYAQAEAQFTKKGAIRFGGNVREFYEWEFRTRALYESTQPDRRGELAHTVLEGLYDNAYLVARDFGLANLIVADGIPNLIQAMEEYLFPITGVEAKELYDQGHKPSGPMSRQAGESLYSYISRRRRWWSVLNELDATTQLSQELRADLLLDMSGLTEQQKLLIKTAVANRRDFDEIARQLCVMFPNIHRHEKRANRKGKGKGKGKSKGSGLSLIHI